MYYSDSEKVELTYIIKFMELSLCGLTTINRPVVVKLGELLEP